MITWTKTAHVEHHLITSSPLSEWPATLTDLRDALATLTPEQVAEVVGEPVATPAVEVLRLERDDARRQLAVAVRESERARADGLARELAECLEDDGLARELAECLEDDGLAREPASDVAKSAAQHDAARLQLDAARLQLDEALREQAPRREPKPHWASRWEDGDIVEEDRTRLHAYSSHCIRVSKDQQSLLLIADDALALIARHWPELLRGGK